MLRCKNVKSYGIRFSPHSFQNVPVISTETSICCYVKESGNISTESVPKCDGSSLAHVPPLPQVLCESSWPDPVNLPVCSPQLDPRSGVLCTSLLGRPRLSSFWLSWPCLMEVQSQCFYYNKTTHDLQGER